jgi:hypothetical protein
MSGLRLQQGTKEIEMNLRTIEIEEEIYTHEYLWRSASRLLNQ